MLSAIVTNSVRYFLDFLASQGISTALYSEYTKMMAEAREQAIQRMTEDAEKGELMP